MEERITSATVLSDGRLVSCVVANTLLGNFSRLILSAPQSSNQSSISRKISGFPENNSTIESIVELQNNQLLALISLTGGSPPFELAMIDVNTGRISFEPELGLPLLESNKRYSNLSLSPLDGKIYATSLDIEGITTLVQLDLEQKSILTGRGRIITILPLKFQGVFLDEDLQSLAFAPSGELFGLGKVNKFYKSEINSLLNVSITDGQMSELTQLNVYKIAIAR